MWLPGGDEAELDELEAAEFIKKQAEDAMKQQKKLLDTDALLERAKIRSQEPKAKLHNDDDVILLVNRETNAPAWSCTRKRMRMDNLWHRAVFVFVENSDGQFLV